MRGRLLGASLCVFVLAVACSGDDGDDRVTTADRTTTTGEVGPQPSPGCTAAPVAVAPGDEKVTLVSGGTERSYFRHVPTGYSPTSPVPVVLDFHGYAEGAAAHVQHSALGPFGDEKRFATITPQGLGAIARWDTGLDSADVRFVGELLDEVERTLCVDERRVFVTGLSNGAFMTSAVACAYADRIAAAAPVAGIRDIDGCRPARPVPVVAFHGTADTFVSFDGGLGEGARNLPAPDGSGRTIGESGIATDARERPSIPEMTTAWAKRNGCATEPEESRVADDVTLVSYKCPCGADAQLYRIADGGHSWPGSAFSKAIVNVVGHTTFSISANEVMWRFFEQHPRR